MEFELFYRCRFATKRDVERVEFEPLYSCRLATHRVWACSVSRVDCSTCRLCVFWLLSCGQQFLVQKTWEMLLWLRRADLLTMVGPPERIFSHPSKHQQASWMTSPRAGFRGFAGVIRGQASCSMSHWLYIHPEEDMAPLILHPDTVVLQSCLLCYAPSSIQW